MISALDISTSGLLAQRARLDAIAGNIANVSSVKTNRNGLARPTAGSLTSIHGPVVNSSSY